MLKIQVNDANYTLYNWTRLNEALLIGVPADDLMQLLEAEKAGRNRRSFLIRIQARICRLEQRSAVAALDSVAAQSPGRKGLTEEPNENKA